MLRMEIALFLVLAFVAMNYFTAERRYSQLHRTFALLLVTVLQAVAGFTKPDAVISEKSIDETKVVSTIAANNPLFSDKNAILEQFRVIF